MGDRLRSNLTERSLWLRLVYMILFAVIFNIAQLVLYLVVVVQFLEKVFTGQVNQRLRSLGQGLGSYVQEIIAFLTFVTERKPFPFHPWPDVAVADKPPAQPDDETPQKQS